MSVDAIWAAVQAVFWVTMLGLLLRWPGRVIGIGAALVLWTVLGPWAFWLALAAVVAGALAWPRVRRGPGLLVTHPELQVAVVGLVVAALAPVWVGLVGFVVALAIVVRLAWNWPPLVGRIRGNELEVSGAAGVGEAAGSPSGFLGAGAVVVDMAVCERCGGHLVASAQIPGPGEGLGVAHATCHGCGLRLVGIVDPSAPAGQQLVWMEPPGSEQWEQSA